ncbi:MAG: HAD family hydrolase [Dysgonamonadaceae bacterium]|jgi:phosphoglycolate phosphatase|nr:HAD family hydrolase [Dysgonamonadaceae bacterium]
MKNKIKLVIFDLDGTLLDTIADLAESTNQALHQHGFPIHPVNDYKFFVGNGINKLFEKALPEGAKTAENILRIRQSFLPCYSQHNTNHSVPYSGIPELLVQLQKRNILLAVASNKYQEASLKLTAHYFPRISFVKVLGQREGIAPKPDATIVHEILLAAHVHKEEALYVGDSGIDMQTAHNSGVIACGVTWGFRPRSELALYYPQFIVDRPEMILDLIDKSSRE